MSLKRKIDIVAKHDARFKHVMKHIRQAKKLDLKELLVTPTLSPNVIQRLPYTDVKTMWMWHPDPKKHCHLAYTRIGWT